MVIYIHGFSGSGEGVKARAFREYFKSEGDTFIAPSLSYIPDLAIIGSSLGGYYTIYLANKYNLKAVLINPSIHPYITLKKVLGDAPSFYDESSFTWMESHIKMLKKYETKVQSQTNFMLLVQKGDEILEYKEALDKLPDANIVLEDGGSHSFDGIAKHFYRIRSFFGL